MKRILKVTEWDGDEHFIITDLSEEEHFLENAGTMRGVVEVDSFPNEEAAIDAALDLVAV